MNQIKFFQTLFDPEDTICLTKTARGTAVTQQSSFNAIHQFVSINALHPNRDFNPTENYHDPNKPRRADHNVIKFRNFLIEMDDVPLDLQIEIVNARIPTSTCVFSGGKSYHFIVSLEDCLGSLDAYKIVASRLLDLFPEADSSCRNPSRLSRAPGVIRPEYNKEQKLIYVRDRVPNAEFIALLPEISKAETRSIRSKGTPFLMVQLLETVNNPDAAIERMNINGRNQFFYWLYNRLYENGLTKSEIKDIIETAYMNLKDKSNFPISEAYMAARVRG